MTSTQTFWPHAQVLAGACLLKPYRHILSTQRSPALTLNITKYYFVNNNSETLKEKINGLWSTLSWHKVYEVLQGIAFCPWAGLKVVCEERWAFSPKWLWIPQTLKTHSTLWPLVSHWHPLKKSLWFWRQDGYGQYFLNPSRVFKCTWSVERHCVMHSPRHFSRTPAVLHPPTHTHTMLSPLPSRFNSSVSLSAPLFHPSQELHSIIGLDLLFMAIRKLNGNYNLGPLVYFGLNG